MTNDPLFFGRTETDWLPLKENPEESINTAIDQNKAAFAAETEAAMQLAQQLEKQKAQKWTQLVSITETGAKLKKQLDEKNDIESQWDLFQTDLDKQNDALEKAKVEDKTNFYKSAGIPQDVLDKGQDAIDEYIETKKQQNEVDKEIYQYREDPDLDQLYKYQVLKTPTHKELSATGTARANYEGDQFIGFLSTVRNQQIQLSDLDKPWSYYEAMEAGEWDIAKRLEKHIFTAYIQQKKLNNLSTSDKKIFFNKAQQTFKLERTSFLQEDIKNDIKVTKANEVVGLVNDINNSGAGALLETITNKGGGYLERHSLQGDGSKSISKAGVRLINNLNIANDLGLADSTDIAKIIDDKTLYPAKDGSGSKTFEQINPGLFQSLENLHNKWQVQEANEIEQQLKADAIVLVNEKTKEFEEKIEQGQEVSNDDIQQALSEVATELGINADHEYLNRLRNTATSFTGDDNEIVRYIERDMNNGLYFEDPYGRVAGIENGELKRKMLKKIKEHNKTTPGVELLKEFNSKIQPEVRKIAQTQGGFLGVKNSAHMNIEDNAKASYLRKMRSYLNPNAKVTLSEQQAHDQAIKEVKAEILTGQHTDPVITSFDDDDLRNIVEQMDINTKQIKAGVNPIVQNTPWLGESSSVIKQAHDYREGVYGVGIPKYYLEIAEQFKHLTPHELMELRLKALNATDGKYTPPPESSIVNGKDNNLLINNNSPGRTHRVLTGNDAVQLLKVIQEGYPNNSFDTIKSRGRDITALHETPISSMNIQELSVFLNSLDEGELHNYSLGMYNIPAVTLIDLIIQARRSGVIENTRLFNEELQSELLLFKNKLDASESCKLNGLDCIPPELVHLSKEEQQLYTDLMSSPGSSYNYFNELIPDAARFSLTLPADRRARNMEPI